MTDKEIYDRWVDFTLLRKSGWTYKKIGEKYNIDKKTVSERIKKGEPQKQSVTKWTYPSLPKSKMKGRNRVRMIVRIRDGFTCQSCGTVLTPQMAFESNKRLFDIHHLNGLCGKKSKGYDRITEIDGLITLCHKCHFNRHDFSREGSLKMKSGVGVGE